MAEKTKEELHKLFGERMDLPSGSLEVSEDDLPVVDDSEST